MSSITNDNKLQNATLAVSAALKDKSSLSQAINKSIPQHTKLFQSAKLIKAVKSLANNAATQSTGNTTQSATVQNSQAKADGSSQTIEGVKVEGYDSLTQSQKDNLSKELKTYKNKITESIKNGDFDKFIEKAFGRKVDNPAELAKLKEAALKGEWDKVIPKIKLGSQSDFATAKNANGQSVNAMGAFIKGSGEGGATGTIILNKEMLNGPVKVNGKAMTFQNVLTEEAGHAWDARLNKTDSKGDEGEALSLMFTSVDKKGAELQKIMNDVDAALSQNDHGTMTVTDSNGNEKTIEVEFGFLSKAWKKIKKGVKKIGKAIKKVGNAVVDGIKSVGEAVVKGVKKLAQSKIFAVVLQVAQFIPVLAPFATVAKGVMAAYNVAKGIKDGNLGQIIGGVAGGALGGAAKVLGASASTLSTVSNVASMAGKVSGVMNTVNAIKNGDITGALMSGAAAANGAGLIDQNTAVNIQNIAKITNVVQTGDVSRGIQLGLQYANGSEWAQQNQEGINKVNSAFNLYQTVANGSDADRINAAAHFGQQMGVLNNQTATGIQSATNFVSAVKTGNVNQITNTLAENNFINQNTANQIQSVNQFATAVKTGNVNQIANTLLDNQMIDATTAARIKTANSFATAIKTGDVNQFTDSLSQNNLIDETTANRIKTANNFATAIKTGDVNQFATSLAQNDMINTETADNVVRLSDYYNNASQHKNSIEQMIRTESFNPEAANDAYNFMMTGTNGAMQATNQLTQSTTAFNPSFSSSPSSVFSTSGINGGFSANSFSGDYIGSESENRESSVRVRPEGGLEISITANSDAPEEQSRAQSVLTTGTDIATDFIPGVSNIKDGTIALTGVNPITGEKVGWGGRLMSGIFALPVVGNATKYIARGGEAIYKGVKSVGNGAEVTQGVATTTGKQIDNVSKESINKIPSLREATRSTFLKGAAERVVLNEPLTVYRVHGGKAGKVGRFTTTDIFKSKADARNDLALLQEWGNSITKITRVELPKGTTIWVGRAAPQVGKNGNVLAGGGSQVFIDGDIKASWFKETKWFRSDVGKN